MNKYMDIDLIESLRAVIYQNTEFYQGNFEIDKKDSEKAVSMPNAADRTFLWLSRPCGTNQLDALKHILWEEKEKRDRLKNVKFKKYLTVLQDKNIRKIKWKGYRE